jgi:uncharacterized sulfatase
MSLSRRSFLNSASLAPALAFGQKPGGQKYNVLFIASDDMNNALGCYGHPVVKSPNIDRVAAGGMRFDRAYCQYPLCGPSRTSLLSGRRPDTTRIWDNQIAVRDKMPDVVTLPQLFRQNGYRSVRIGKMYHMDVPGSVGTNRFDDPPSWDRAFSPPGKENHTEGEARNVTPKIGAGGAFHWIQFRGEGKDQADRVAADEAVAEIEKNKDRPWFLGLGFLRPHVPHVAPGRFFDLYPLETLNPFVNPPGDRDDIPRASEIAINTRGNDMGMNDRDKREALRSYYASVSYMDSLVGEVTAALDRFQLRNRTIIVFWGDHGWHLGEHFRWQKRSLFEESARVPLIVSAPGRKAPGRSTRALVELVDLYPSLAQLCGLPAPPGLEGQSFVPLLDNPARAWKSAAFTQVFAPNGIAGRAVKTDRYRYIRWEGPYPDEELYDHQNDPREFTNLARRPQNAGELKRLRGVLDAGWRAAQAQA